MVRLLVPISSGVGTLSSSIKASCGYTLAEIVIVMLVIAVIVAVTIGITRHKLDNIVTYTYYSAYSLLRTATSQMLVDYDPNDERYQAKVENSSILAKAKMFFDSNFGILAADALYRRVPFGLRVEAIGFDSNIGDDTIIGGQQQGCCPSGFIHQMTCPTYPQKGCASALNNCDGFCVSSDLGGSGSSGGTTWITCQSGYSFCSCTSSGAVPSNVGVGCCCRSDICQPTGTAPCGKEWDYSTCSWVSISGFSIYATQPSITSPRLCGGILVAIPTAIPIVPLTKIFGNLLGKISGSFSVSSKLSTKSTVFLLISRVISKVNLASLASV